MNIYTIVLHKYMQGHMQGMFPAHCHFNFLGFGNAEYFTSTYMHLHLNNTHIIIHADCHTYVPGHMSAKHLAMVW